MRAWIAWDYSRDHECTQVYTHTQDLSHKLAYHKLGINRLLWSCFIVSEHFRKIFIHDYSHTPPKTAEPANGWKHTVAKVINFFLYYCGSCCRAHVTVYPITGICVNDLAESGSLDQRLAAGKEVFTDFPRFIHPFWSDKWSDNLFRTKRQNRNV